MVNIEAFVADSHSVRVCTNIMLIDVITRFTPEPEILQELKLQCQKQYGKQNTNEIQHDEIQKAKTKKSI